MSNHTPGPWVAEIPEDGADRVGVSQMNGDRFICQCARWGGDEDIANANLIAAAPELRSALNHCLDALYNETHSQEDSHWIKEV